MNFGLQTKRAVITGSGRGIGRACALALAAEGAQVLLCSRTASDNEAVLEQIGGATNGHAAIVLDLTAGDAPQTLTATALEHFGGVDILVHNVGGTLDVRDPLAPLVAWRNVWRLNLEVAVELNALLVPGMIERHWGRVVSIGSVAGIEHQGAVTYAVAKAALSAYTRALGRELAATGVVIAAVAPGTVRTDGGVWDRRQTNDPELVERYIAERLPAGRFQEPQAIAQTVAFLCSVQAADFNGSVVQVDGGQGRAFAFAG